MAARVSVLVPFYNHAALAAETIESVLAQGYDDYEVILADDASTDGTPDVLRGFAAAHPDRITLLAAEHNRGIGGNFNAALSAARGELVAWLGGDDVMHPDKLSAQVAALDRHPEAVACVHDAEVFVSGSGETLGRFSTLYNGTPGIRSGGVELQFDPTYFMLPSATMFRRAAAPEHGFDERLRFANDWLWSVELLRNGSVVALQDVLVRYRRHDGNITADADAQAQILEEGLIALAVVEARYPELHRHARRRAAAFHLSAAREMTASHQWRQAARRARIALSVGGAVGSAGTALQLAKTRIQRRGDTPR